MNHDAEEYLVYTTSNVIPCFLSSLPAAAASALPSDTRETSCHPIDSNGNDHIKINVQCVVQIHLIYIYLSHP